MALAKTYIKSPTDFTNVYYIILKRKNVHNHL